MFFALVFMTPMMAQQGEKEAIKSTIELFFDGFHKQDSSIILQSVSRDILLQTVVQSDNGDAQVRKQAFNDFLRSIIGIPATTKFKEVLKGFSIHTDGLMAQAWTPYEFWVNGTLSHCGVNAFHLIKEASGWKIIYLIDTRKKEGCF